VVKAKKPNNAIQAPPKRGNAPVGEDGNPIELHHIDQEADEVIEMTQTEHRLGENYAKNHSNTGSSQSNIDRSLFKKQKKQYWKDEWDSGRFNNNSNN
jgi:hypothetical protein